jgi:chitinase
VKLDPDLLRRGTNVIAVQVHRGAGNAGPLTFDAELNANAGPNPQAPVARFANIADGTLLRAGSVAQIDVDALKPDGAVRSATLLANGRPVQTLSRAPFRFRWPVKAGANRMSVSVTGDDGLMSLTHATVNGVRNVPPTVRLSAPADHIRLDPGQTVTVVAQASDPDGRIARVEFYAQESYIFGAPARLLGSVTKAPYAVRVTDFRSDHAMIVAVAYDAQGARTASIPIMVMVNGRAPK